MKKIYIAAPFFTPQQIALVEDVERAILKAGLRYYSPKDDGILQNMSAEERTAMGPKLFELNVKMIRECDATLALKEYSDTGTTWETGFAYGIDKPLFGYGENRTKPLNIMVAQCFDAVLYGRDELDDFLETYARGESIKGWSGRELKDTY